MRRDTLSQKGYTAREEKRLLDAFGRGLLKEFPNPERAGCPGSELLRGIAFRKVPLAEAEPWLEHLVSCSPCYHDFSQFREAYQRRRNRTILAVAASILLVASAAGWALVQKRNQTRLAQTIVVDLRNRSVARGSEPVPTKPPLEIGRTVSHLDIYLPLGSSEGSYDVRIIRLSGETVTTARATAQLKAPLTTLDVRVNLSSALPGKYVLQVRSTGLEWSSYPIVLR